MTADRISGNLTHGGSVTPLTLSKANSPPQPCSEQAMSVSAAPPAPQTKWGRRTVQIVGRVGEGSGAAPQRPLRRNDRYGEIRAESQAIFNDKSAHPGRPRNPEARQPDSGAWQCCTL